MGIKEYEKQHIVPISYLKYFARKNSFNKGYHIGVWRKGKPYKQPFCAAVDNVAYVKNYYDVLTRENPKYWENFFSREFEPLYGTPQKNFISKVYLTRQDKSVLTDQDKQRLAEMICFQFFRIPKFLDPLIKRGSEYGKGLQDFLIRVVGEKLSAEQKKQLTLLNISEAAKDLSFEAISDKDRMARFVKILEKQTWVIFVNNTSKPFITSDNPVILYNFRQESTDYHNSGIERLDTITIFPISTKLMIMILPISLSLGWQTKWDGLRIPIDNKDVDIVNRVNELQIDHATKEVYIDPNYLDAFMNTKE